MKKDRLETRGKLVEGSGKNFTIFRASTAVLITAICLVFGSFVKNSLADSLWSEPPWAPGLNNVNPPIWNQNTAAQTGGLYVTGSGRFDANNYGNAYCLPTGSKVCGADNGSIWGVVGESNSGYGLYGSSVSSYGIYASSSSSYAGYFAGPIYVNGTISQGGKLVCLEDGTNCASAGGYWSPSGGNIINNNTGGNVNLLQASALAFANGQTIKDNGGGGLAITSPTYRLQLYAGTDPTNGVMSFFTNGSERMTIINNGNVGIGTATPQGRMQVNLTKTASGTVVNEVGDYADSFVISTSASSNNGDKIPLVFNVGNPTSPHISSVIEAGREASGWNTYLAFYTNNITSGTEGVDAIQEKMRLTSNGYLGIGTASPAYQLHVYGSGIFGGNNSLLYFPNDTYRASPGTNNSSMIGRADNDNYHVTGSVAGDIVLGSVNGGLTLGTSNSVTYPTARLRITNAGNVGIGNNAPGQLLTVGSAGRQGAIGVAGTTSGVVTLTTAAAAGTWTLTLPTSAGSSGQVLTTNGSGSTSWTTVSSSGVTGSGTINYVPLFTGSSSIGNSVISQNGSNIGIGTTTAGVPLVAYSTTANLTNNPGNSQIRAQASSTRWLSLGYDSSNNVGYIQAAESGVAWRNLILEYNGGNVGIGTVSPAQRLDVSGYIRASTGYCIGSSCITSWPSGGGLSGSGSTNYLARWTGSSSLGNSSIYDTGTNVGIGTTSNSTYKLRVNGGSRFTSVGENQALYVDSPYVGIVASGDGITITSVPTQGAIYGAGSNGTWAIKGDNASSGAGVEGSSWSGNGVYGYSYYGYGVSGYSSSGYGVYGDGSTYGFYTPDQIYAGSSISSNGTVSGYYLSATYSISAGSSVSGTNFTASSTSYAPFYASSYTSAGQFVGNWGTSDYWGIGPNNGGSDRIIRVGSSSWNGAWNTNYITLYVYGYLSTANYIYSGNYVQAAGNMFAVSFVPSSDARLKRDISDLGENSGLKIVNALKPVSFHWKDAERDQREQLGFIAQDVEKIVPGAVTANSDGYLGVNYNELVAPTIKAVQELDAEVERNKNEANQKIDALQKQIDEIKAKMK